MTQSAQVRVLKLIVASPGDVMPERKGLDKVVTELNKTVAAHFGLHINVLRWEIDSYPAFHLEGPQGHIDQLFDIRHTDILVGIFWKRFGTPTHGVGSGTEHEFDVAYEAWKASGGKHPQLMIYFKKKPFSPSTTAETEQWGKVLEFRARFPREGLGWEYKTTEDFEQIFRVHLTRYLLANVSHLGGTSYQIIKSQKALYDTNQRIVNEASDVLFMTGSRSRDTKYLASIEARLKANPDLIHYRVLFGPPHHQILKDHLLELLNIRNPSDRSLGHQTLYLGLYDNTLRQFETFILGNETEVLVLLPSFTGMGQFDSGIVFSDKGEVESLKRFVQQLYSASDTIEKPAKVEALKPLKD